MNSIAETVPAQAPSDLHSFEPSAQRAGFLDQRMRERLVQSLRYILDQGSAHLDPAPNQVEIFLRQLQTGPSSPLAFSYYSDIVLAIEEDDLEGANRFFRELIALPVPSSRLTIKDLANPANDPIAARYARFIDTDESFKFEIFPPTPEAAAHCREQIRAAFELMDAGDPELADEIRALLREIILGAGTQEPKAMTFDGASAFMLWGAIIINSNRPEGALAMAQMLAHESAHNLLFGLSADDCLVENSPEELFSSPLRVDPRPMDGIYHATFVTARMHRVVRRLSESGVLSSEMQGIAQKEMIDNARLFANGFETVQRHAKLTALGAALMEGASQYMSD